MGKELKDYVQRIYPGGKRDLYAAFIQRNRAWVKEHGIVAMVTQQSWMFLRSFVKMREEILKKNCIQTLAHLGPHAFAEISGEVVNAVLFTLAKEKPDEEHRLFCFKITSTNNSHEKNSLILKSISNKLSKISYTPIQSDFLLLPEFSLPYWLQGKVMQLLTMGNRLNIDVVEPSTTGDNERFFRYRWEVCNYTRWIPSSKGGGYRKWCGFDFFLIDWENNGQRIKSFPGSYIRNEQYMFRYGLTFSQMTRGSMGVRLLPKNGTFGKAGPGIFPKEMSNNIALGILNSRLISYILRAINTKLTFSTGSLLALPAPVYKNTDIETLVDFCISLKKSLINSEQTEYEFENYIKTHPTKTLIIKLYDWNTGKKLLSSSLLHSVESKIEETVLFLYEIDKEEFAFILDELGYPPGWYPLIQGYDPIPQTDICEIPSEVGEYLNNHERINPCPEELIQIKSRLCALYEAGPGAKVEDVIEEEDTKSSDDEYESEALIGKRIPIPTETFLEELSVKMEIHPISIY